MKRTMLSIMVLTFVISFGGLLLVLYRLSPYDVAPWLSLTLFVVSTLISCASLATLLGAVVRMLLFKEEMYMIHFLISLRQGVLFSFCVLGVLALSILDVANIWNIGLYFISILFVEMYFLTNDKQVL